MKNLFLASIAIAIVLFFVLGGDIKRDLMSIVLDIDEMSRGDSESRPLAYELAAMTFSELPRVAYQRNAARFVEERRAVLRSVGADSAANVDYVANLYASTYSDALSRNERRIADYWRWRYDAPELAEIKDFLTQVGWLNMPSVCAFSFSSSAATSELPVMYGNGLGAREAAQVKAFAQTPTGKSFLSSCKDLTIAFAQARNAFDERTEWTVRRTAQEWMQAQGLPVPDYSARQVSAEVSPAFQSVGMKLKSAGN